MIFMTMRLRLPATPTIVLRCALAWMIAGPAADAEGDLAREHRLKQLRRAPT